MNTFWFWLHHIPAGFVWIEASPEIPANLLSGFLSCLVSSSLMLAQSSCVPVQLMTIVLDEWRGIILVIAVLLEHSDRSLMQAVAFRICPCATNPCGPDWKWGEKAATSGSFSLPITLRRKHQIREIRFGGLSATAWTQPKCRATILMGLRWREIRGCWPALRHSWNSKQQSQELKLDTPASHTPLSLNRPPSSVSLAFSPLLLLLPLFKLRSWRFLALHQHQLDSVHPPLTLPHPASLHIPPTPLLHFQRSAAERLWPHLNIWMYINLLLTGAWRRFMVAQLWWCYGTICAGLTELTTS